MPMEEPGRDVVEDIRKMTATASGTYAVYVYRLGDGRGWGVNEDEIMPGASILKLPALLAAWPKKEETWVLEKADIAAGSGPLQFLKAGTAVTVERVMTELGKKSDNTAWRMINRRLGYKEIEKEIEKMGLTNTNYRELTTTAADVGKIMRKIHEKPDLWQYLEDSVYEDRITLGLPGGTRLVHKVGTDADVWADAGMVVTEKPFVLVIMNKGVKHDEAVELVPRITRVIWEYESAT